VPAIVLTTAIGAPVERCFDLARSVEQHLDGMRASGERAVAGTTSGLMGMGQEVTWEARHLGVRLRLRSRITAYERPRYFQDSMMSGPFAAFVHDHRFASEHGGTTMRDDVEFRSPLGVLGVLADWLVVGPYLRRLLMRRNRALKRAAEMP